MAIDRNYRLRGLYFKEVRGKDNIITYKPVEFSIRPEEVLTITRYSIENKPETPGVKQSLCNLNSFVGWGYQAYTHQAEQLIASCINHNTVYSFIPLTSFGMDSENWERVRKRKLLRLPEAGKDSSESEISTPVLWVNPVPELLKDSSFVCCGNSCINADIWTNNRYRSYLYRRRETHLEFPDTTDRNITNILWVNKNLVDTAQSALENPVCIKSNNYRLYLRARPGYITIKKDTDYWKKLTEKIFSGRHLQSDNFTNSPGICIHISKIRSIKWKYLDQLLYIIIFVGKHPYSWQSPHIQFVKKVNKKNDTIEKWMESSGIKPRFFRKINEYTYVNRHGGREKDEESESAA